MARKRGLRAFGKWLEGKRLEREMTAPQVARILTEKHGIQVDSSTLYNYEGGTVFAPDPGVLYGLSQVYEIELETIVIMLLMNRKQPAADSLLAPQAEHINVHPDDVPFLELGRRVTGPSRAFVLRQLEGLVQHEEGRRFTNRRAANE